MVAKPLNDEALERVVGGSTLAGGDAGETIIGGGGADLLDGQGGDDSIDAGDGADMLLGGAGDDVLDGGRGDGAADIAHGGEGDDQFVWLPGDGNDEFQGGPGQDRLVVPLPLTAVVDALSVDDPALQLVIRGGEVSFLDADGQPASFSGTITMGAEVLRFTGVERIATLGLVGAPGVMRPF